MNLDDIMIQQKSLQLRLHSPAFLGDAHQSGVWRTPPIKALLREWWRVAAAPESGYDHRSLREIEGLLFGNAWLEPDADRNSRFCKSKVRMALGHWDERKMRKHEPLGKVDHPEAEKAGKKVEPLNYLGYGPIDRGQFRNGAALQAGETSLSPNLRRIEEFKEAFDARAKQLRGGKDNPNTAFHEKAKELAREAAGWINKEERLAAADAIEEWLPRVVKVDIKGERKKLKLSALRSSA